MSIATKNGYPIYFPLPIPNVNILSFFTNNPQVPYTPQQPSTDTPF